MGSEMCIRDSISRVEDLLEAYKTSNDTAVGQLQSDLAYNEPYLGQIEVDSADFWTDRLLSSSSRSTAESLASKRSHTLTLKSS